MRHRLTPATDLTGTASSSAPCVPVNPTPAAGPHGVTAEAPRASIPSILSSILPATSPLPPPPLLSILLPATSTPLLSANVAFPDLVDCVTFDDAINASTVYSQPNISAKAAAENRRLLDTGLGVDQAMVAEHTNYVADHGLLHLLQKCSDSLRHRTLQPVSKRRDPPSQCLALFPVRPATGPAKPRLAC